MDELSRPPEPTTLGGPTAHAPGSQLVPEAPAIGSRFGIFRPGDRAPLGPYIMRGTDSRSGEWLIRPAAWDDPKNPQPDNHQLQVAPMRHGTGHGEWEHADAIEAGIGWYSERPAEPRREPTDDERLAQGGP